MSADNWATCPRCVANAEHEAEAHALRVEQQYGKVPIEQFEAARASLTPVDPETYRTFREDYEFHSHDGTVEAHYKGHCGVCSLHCEFDEHRTFWTPPTPDICAVAT